MHIRSRILLACALLGMSACGSDAGTSTDTVVDTAANQDTGAEDDTTEADTAQPADTTADDTEGDSVAVDTVPGDVAETPAERARAALARARAAVVQSRADRLDLAVFAVRTEGALGDVTATAAEGLAPLALTTSATNYRVQRRLAERGRRNLEAIVARPEAGREDLVALANELLAAQDSLTDELAARLDQELAEGDPEATVAPKYQKTWRFLVAGEVSLDLDTRCDRVTLTLSCAPPSTSAFELATSVGITVSDTAPRGATSFVPTAPLTTFTVTPTGANGTASGPISCTLQQTGTQQQVSSTLTLSEAQQAAVGDQLDQGEALQGELDAELAEMVADDPASADVADAIADTAGELTEATAPLAEAADSGTIDPQVARDALLMTILACRERAAITGAAGEDGATGMALLDETCASALQAALLSGSPSTTMPSSEVTTLAETGTGSLRSRIMAAADGATITFAAGLSGTITVSTPIPIKDKALTLVGPGAEVLTVSGGDQSGIFIVDAAGAAVTLSGLTLAHGAATNGGAIDVANGALVLDAVTLSDNVATDYGGAVNLDLANGSSLTVTRSIFRGNTADFGGAFVGNADLVSATLFEGNHAGVSGGAIAGRVTVVNSTFSGNQSGNQGGAISTTGSGESLVTACTFARNTATTKGGAIYHSPDADHVLRVFASLFGGNSASEGPSIHASEQLVTSFDVLTDASGATGMPAATDMVAAQVPLPELADNGGPTPTILPPPVARDVVSAAACAQTDGVDQRGEARPPGQACDAGAVEVQSAVCAANAYADYAPPAGCRCLGTWTYAGQTVCGGQCDTPDGAASPWCMTDGACQGKAWASCTLPSACPANAYADYSPPTGCACKGTWAYNGETVCGGQCANPDDDPAGPWCFTDGTCDGATFAYCTGPL
ncbi:MAG: hypothetical protein EP329_08230 [Deltaproteobacteria bacterium]|nr:MAG: hypothetical protein EP329_08230 [Deltaproteobacteria bacterium]